MRLTSDSVLDGLPAGTSGVMDDYRRIVRRRLLLILLLALLIVASLLLDFMLGPSGLPLQSLWQTLTDPASADPGTRAIVWDIRLPYAVMAIIVGLALVMAGALGNIIDSAFYGLIFSESTPYAVAHFGGHYAGFMMGKVVDMFYFPLFQWNNVPRFLSFLVDSNNYFFGAIFNLADAYISVAVVYLLLFQHKFFSK